MPATAAAAATTDGSRCDRGRTRRSLRTELDGEVDDDVARLARNVVDADLVAVALLNLAEQRQRIVVVDEAHDLAVLERLERTEDGGMAEALGNAARIEGVNSVIGHLVSSIGGSGLEPAAGIAARESYSRARAESLSKDKNPACAAKVKTFPPASSGEAK